LLPVSAMLRLARSCPGRRTSGPLVEEVDDMLHDLFDLLGIKGPVVAAGLAGGVLRALSQHRYKLREMVASPICGALAAAYLTLPAVSYFKSTGLPMPAPADETTTLAAAFLIGVSAMWITDILFDFVVRKLRHTPSESD
jgi:hypothetical protein